MGSAHGPERMAGSTEVGRTHEDRPDALIEALLLVAPEPVAPADLADAADIDESAVEEALGRMGGRQGRGWILVRHDGRVSLATDPQFAPQIRRFLRLDRETRLTGAALETLAVVAYRQPVGRGEIEAVRGVDCTAVLSTLHARGLIEQAGRGPGVGAPILYATTTAFLHHFGLRSIDELPPLGDIGGRDPGILVDHALASSALVRESIDPGFGGTRSSPDT